MVHAEIGALIEPASKPYLAAGRIDTLGFEPSIASNAAGQAFANMLVRAKVPAIGKA
jgi:hypothetical protein